jgi:hypothetical protein
MSKETCLRTLLTRTGSPSLHPRLASGDATDFLLASALSYSPTGLATSRWRRRAMRPTDVCHPNDCCVHPHLARSRLALATFAAGSPHGVLGSAWHFRGPGRFTTSVVASADRSTLAYLELYCLTAWRHERGRFLPTVRTRSSLCHPCRDSRSASRLARFRERCNLWPSVPLLKGFERVGGCDSRLDHR